MVARLAATCATRSRILQHPLALADDVGETVALLQRALELDVFALQPAFRDHALDLDQQFFVVPGLGEIIVGAALQRIHGDLRPSRTR